MGVPNRWMHLRHPDGFDDAMFALFRAHCDVWQAYVQAVTRHWSVLGAGGRPPEYEFFPPERSPDRRIVTLPVGGYQTLGSRAAFEDASSRLLSEYLPLETKKLLDEGLTETINPTRSPETFWRPVLRHTDGSPVFPRT